MKRRPQSVKVIRDEKENEAVDSDDDFTDFDFDANDEYTFSDLDVDEFVASLESDNSDGEDCMDMSGEEDSDNETSDDNETSESDDDSDCEVPTPLTALPPKVLEPYHLIQRVQRVKLAAMPKGYRLCGDNIDMSVRPRFKRSDNKNTSLHYFHSYAVQNRVDVSQLSDTLDPSQISLQTLLFHL